MMAGRRIGRVGPPRTVALLVALVALVAGARPSAAEIDRFAVVIGNDRGADGDVELRFAEADAERVAGVLSHVGGFAPDRIVLLRGLPVADVVRSLIAVNDRVRARAAPGRDTFLFVYYSGHADRQALHLDGGRLPLEQVEQLVRGSAATVRMLVLDACHSGALTRVKGGRGAPPVELPAVQHLRGEGLVFLTSSSASEEAQESDELGGSFFTHYFVSGLLGAADSNRDGVVVLKEAYRHAHESTIRASSRTAGGIQHPTFRYELGGQGDIVLSRLVADRHLSRLRLPTGMTFLVLDRDREGRVVAEIGAEDRARVLAVAPGRYFVRGRGERALLEGSIDVPRGAEVAVDEGALTRIEYARLVRKGGVELERSHGFELGATARTAITEGATPCFGLAAALIREQRAVRLTARLAACRARLANQAVRTTSDELGLDGRIGRAWDTRAATFDVGVALGLAGVRQTFETAGRAPTRTALAAYLEAGASATRYLTGRLYAVLEVAGRGYAVRLEHDGERALTVRPGLVIGVRVGAEF